MKIINSLSEINNTENFPTPIGLVIGNFDGIHLGHRSLIQRVKEQCLHHQLKLVLMTFNPHPQKILNPSKENFLISSYEQRRETFNKLGVDFLLEIPFTRDFSTLSAEDFLDQYIFLYPRLHTFYLGYDFAFGANKHAGHDLVKKICDKRGIAVEVQPKFSFENTVVSSSLIRESLIKGNLSLANKLLGRSFELEGVVVKGEGRGKKIGFPTANIHALPDLIIPQIGVYITRTHYSGMTYESITNVGHNPTFKSDSSLNIETNIFDFNVDIYGEKIKVEFLEKIRDEKKFATVNDLISQIKTDVDYTKNYFKKL
jgi:riboflavin kinase/FMN adenylyltransferase